jgi:hypothetical protein
MEVAQISEKLTSVLKDSKNVYKCRPTIVLYFRIAVRSVLRNVPNNLRVKLPQ